MERRLSAILAADVVGYSRLMEADEEATVHILGNLSTGHRRPSGETSWPGIWECR